MLNSAILSSHGEQLLETAHKQMTGDSSVLQQMNMFDKARNPCLVPNRPASYSLTPTASNRLSRIMARKGKSLEETSRTNLELDTIRCFFFSIP